MQFPTGQITGERDAVEGMAIGMEDQVQDRLFIVEVCMNPLRQ